jgi:hypothetical protein
LQDFSSGRDAQKIEAARGFYRLWAGRQFNWGVYRVKAEKRKRLTL